MPSSSRSPKGCALPLGEVIEEGSGDTLVALLHGVLDRGRSFERVAALLHDEARTIRYDRRGYDGMPDDDYADIWGHADDLLGLLDGRPAVVVGHSFGGMTALAAARQAPELVRAVVLYEMAVAWAPEWNDAPMIGVLADPDPEGAGLRLLFPDFDSLPAEVRARRRAQAAAFIAEERSVRIGRPAFSFADVHVPVLYGRGDQPVFEGVVEHLRRHLPRFADVRLPGSGHDPHRHEPERFADLVRRGVALAAGLG